LSFIGKVGDWEEEVLYSTMPEGEKMLRLSSILERRRWRGKRLEELTARRRERRLS
jgi:hypothetical protein